MEDTIEFIESIADYKDVSRFPYLGIYQNCFKTYDATQDAFPGGYNYITQSYDYFLKDGNAAPFNGPLSIPQFEFSQLKEICPPLSESENVVIYSFPKITSSSHQYIDPSQSLVNQIRALNNTTKNFYCLLEFNPNVYPAGSPYMAANNREPTAEERDYLVTFFGGYKGISVRFIVDYAPAEYGSGSHNIYTLIAASTYIQW